jgi:hypothetical protein
MKLPVELRVMIAEYALAYKGGLDWYWTEKDGTRIGRLKPVYSSEYNPETVCPLQMLCLSRQLRQETSQIWLKVNVLNFDGDIDERDRRNLAITSDSLFGEALDSFEFFHRRINPAQFAMIQTVTIKGFGIADAPNAVQRIPSVRCWNPHYNLRIIDQHWYCFLDTKNCAAGFMEKGRVIQASLRRNIEARDWRVFPHLMEESEKEWLRGHLSDAEFEVGLSYIRDGV